MKTGFLKSFAFLAVWLQAAVAPCTVTIPVVDHSAHEIARLAVVRAGEVRCVRLDELLRVCGGTVQHSGDELTLTIGNTKARVRTGNAFAARGTEFVQLGLAPFEHEGAIWVALEDGVQLLDSSVVWVSKDTVRVLAGRAHRNAGGANEPAWTLRTVVIDPGHGGRDPGAVGLFGLHEKWVTLDIAQRLAALLRRRGVGVELTRDSDQFLTLQERTRFANARRGDLFLSIHCNGSRKRHVKGAEAYFLSPARTARAVDVALRENSVVKLEADSAAYAELTEETYILLTMATSQYLRDSEIWASQILEALQRTAALENRGVDQAGFYVLMGASMPAVLVECGFLTNPEDAQVLRTEAGRQRIAEGLAQSVMAMKTILEGSASR